MNISAKRLAFHYEKDPGIVSGIDDGVKYLKPMAETLILVSLMTIMMGEFFHLKAGILVSGIDWRNTSEN